MKQPQRGSSLLALALILILLAAGTWALLNSRLIYDTIRASRFEPSSEIQHLVKATTMNDSAKRTFYATQPKIDRSSDFKSICHKQQDSGAILGCYVDDSIYIYDVDSAELSGIEEVTAAHEMLHAAYVRLPDSQRSEIDSLIKQQAKALESNSDFAERMQVYDGVDAETRLDELHSIFGTEYSDIDKRLEDYYRGYFDNRSDVVAMYEGYASVFADLKAQAEQLSASLDAQASQINQQKALYEQQVQLFNRRAQNGGFSSREEFEFERQVLLDRQAQINQAIERYNQDLQRYDGIAAHLSELNNSINGQQTTEPRA